MSDARLRTDVPAGNLWGMVAPCRKGRQVPMEDAQRQRPSARRMREIGPGLLGSLALHGLFGLLVLFLVTRPTPQPSLIRFLPVDLVVTAREGPPSPQLPGTRVPHEATSRPVHSVPSSPRHPIALSPTRKTPAPDTLEIRLRNLAKLRQPDSTLPHLDNGAADEAAGNGDAGAGYRVRDFLRAQIERRWSLDLGHARNVVVRIHVVVARDGSVTHADIVDRARYASDASWRAIALSARNAVLLSSPLNLPTFYPATPIVTTLALSSRDVVR